MKPTRRKLSKKHERAREWPQRHGADCGVCAKPRRLRRKVLEREKLSDLMTRAYFGEL